MTLKSVPGPLTIGVSAPMSKLQYPSLPIENRTPSARPRAKLANVGLLLAGRLVDVGGDDLERAGRRGGVGRQRDVDDRESVGRHDDAAHGLGMVAVGLERDAVGPGVDVLVEVAHRVGVSEPVGRVDDDPRAQSAGR